MALSTHESRNVTPVKYPANDNSLARWEGVCEKLTMATSIANEGGKVAPNKYLRQKKTQVSWKNYKH